jgi:5,10-methylenetetrahydromethanopterin reductase
MRASTTTGFRTLGVSATKMSGLPLSTSMSYARDAVAAGFGIVGVGDGAASESFSTIGALAATTSVPELFSAIATWTRTPVTTALGAKTLADLTDGRYRLGLGTMPRPWSEGWHGIDASRPVGRMRDFIGAVRAAWTARPGAPVDYSGPFYEIRGYEPVSRPSWEEDVPLYLGTTLPRMSELAGEVADGVIFNTMTSLEWTRTVLWPSIERGLEQSGRTPRDFDAGMIRICAVDDDAAAAADVARRSLAFYFRVPYFRDILEDGGFTRELKEGYAAAARDDLDGMTAAVSDELIDAVVLCGTPDEVREKLRRYEGLVDWVQLVGTFVQPPDESLRQMQRILSTFAPVASG